MPEGTVGPLRQRLQALQPLLLQIEDDSARHAGHEGAKSGGGGRTSSTRQYFKPR